MKLSWAPLERELLELLGSGRDAQISARYFGFDGLGGGSLQTVGDEYGLTRERVRQIVAATTTRPAVTQSSQLTLDLTITFVTGQMPSTAGEIEARLLSQGLTTRLFRLEGVLNAAQLLGREVSFAVTPAGCERVVHSKDIRSVDAILQIARRTVGRWGVATIPDIAAEAQSVEPGLGDRDLIASVLASQPGFHWLDHSARWFWFSDIPRNRLLNRVRKILAVAPSVELADLRTGISRDYKMEGFLPPDNVLLEFCRQTPGLTVDRQTVTASPPIEPADVLSQIELDIVRALSSHGGVMARRDLIALSVPLGLKRFTLYQHLVYSPFIAEFADGMYGLVGSQGTVLARKAVL